LKDFHLPFFHRVAMALRANADLSVAESFAIRAGPPFNPPSLPSATAAGFFFLTGFAD
jgi:hypothetical protein